MRPYNLRSILSCQILKLRHSDGASLFDFYHKRHSLFLLRSAIAILIVLSGCSRQPNTITPVVTSNCLGVTAVEVSHLLGHQVSQATIGGDCVFVVKIKSEFIDMFKVTGKAVSGREHGLIPFVQLAKHSSAVVVQEMDGVTTLWIPSADPSFKGATLIATPPGVYLQIQITGMALSNAKKVAFKILTIALLNL